MLNTPSIARSGKINTQLIIKLHIVAILLLINFSVKGQQVELPVDFTKIEKAPSFPGGPQFMGRFFNLNFKWPEEAKKAGLSGKIILSFVVEKDGSLADIKVLRDMGMETGAEAVRVMKLMPKWAPGIMDGNPVRVSFTLPLQLSVGDLPKGP